MIMADNPEQAGKGPKDTTPSPMDAVEKKAAAQQPEGAAPAPAPAEETPEDPGPQNVKALLKESIVDSPVWNRLLQILLLAAGIYGIYSSIEGQKFIPLPAMLGGIALVLMVLFDVYIIKKFRKEYQKLEITVRYVLAAIFGLVTILFAVQLIGMKFSDKFPFSLAVNKNVLLIAAFAIVAVFTLNFFLYIAKHKEKLLADVYMFIAFMAGFAAIVIFLYYYVMVSFIFAALSLLALIASLTNDPLKDDGRLQARLAVSAITALMFLGVLAYASTIFFIKPMPVITYGPVTDSSKQRPFNLGWSGDSWSFDYALFDKKDKVGRIGIINALSLGVNELPPKDSEVKLPWCTDAAVWNKNGTSLIFTAGAVESGARSIWAVSLNLSLVAQEIERAKKEAEEQKKAEIIAKEEKDKETVIGGISVEIKKEAEKLVKKDEGLKLKLRSKEDDKLNRPVGKPKVLFADMNLAVELDCLPITHKTAWSPDGRRFCFSAKSKESEPYSVWSADAKSQEMTKLTKGKSKIMPLWSPSGEKILYCTKTDSYSYLKISDYDGRNPRELSVNRAKDRALFPLWNKDESKVIYVKNMQFIVMNANATNQQELSRKSFPVSPYWLTESKKKVKLEFTESGTIWKVWTMNTDGEKEKNIFTEVCDTLAQPKWSYDGKAIALAANYGDGTSSVYRLNKDGSMKARLFTTAAHIAELEWANSSERLAFVAKRPAEKDGEEGTEELWIVEKDATEPRSIYETAGKINHISWNDLGNRIAFDETIRRIYFIPEITTVKVAEARGEDVVFNLLPYEFNAQYPTWSNDGQVLAYVSWNKYWTPGIFPILYGLGDRVWAAQLE